MRKTGGSIDLSVSDLVGYLNCRRLSALDRAMPEGSLSKPFVRDPLLEILGERGLRHELNYVEHLNSAGLDA